MFILLFHRTPDGGSALDPTSLCTTAEELMAATEALWDVFER